MNLQTILCIMVELKEIFRRVEEFDGDVWVADYTEDTKRKPKEYRKGVVISRQPFSDGMESFHLLNKNAQTYYGVNFEENKNFFPKGRKDCECMFKCKDDGGAGWLLLCELKYGLDKELNNRKNARKASLQLEDTFELLKEKHIVNPQKCQCFLNISMPRHKAKLPFTAFVFSPEDIIQLNREKKNPFNGCQ